MEFSGAELEIFSQGTEVFMAILDEKGVFLKANQRWLQRFNISYAELLQKSIFEMVQDGEVGHVQELFASIRERGQISHEVVTLVDSEFKNYSFQLDLTYSDQQIYIVGFDVTSHAREHLSLMDMSRLTKTGAWYHDPIRNETFWSEEVYRIHEMEPGIRIDGEKALDFYVSRDKKKVDDLVDKLYSSFESYDFTGEITTAKGNSKWIRTIAKPMVQEGRIIYICGVTADQTRLHNNLERIKYESETRLLALKGIKSGLFDHNLVTDTVFYSPDFKSIVGLPQSIHLPEPEFRKMIHPADQKDAYQRHLEGLEAPGNHYFNYYRLRQEDKGYQHYEVHAWRKKDQKGKTVRMIGNLINVHDRVIAENERQKVKKSLEAMVDNGFMYSMLLDREGIILMADQRTIDIIEHDYGVNPKIEKVRYVDVMPDIFKKTFQEEFKKAMRGEVVRKEVERPLLEGAMQWLDVMYRPIKNEKEEIEYVLTNLMDITEYKRATLSIKEAEQHAQALNRLKSGILSNLSHELRTPLNGIMGATELLSLKELDEEGRELIEMQKESELRLLKTLTDLIVLSDLDALRLNMRLTTQSVNSIAQTCFDMYHHQANMKNLEFELQKSEVEAIVLVDWEMMIASLGAVVNNALKYTYEGFVKIACHVDEREWVEISVSDTGVGIKGEDFERIFEDFEKENYGLNYKYEGAGIGLSITKKFISLMGGTIEVQSKFGEGSKFVIRLPSTET